MLEAFQAALSIGFEASLLILLVYFYLDELGERELNRQFLIGSLAGLAVGFFLVFLPVGQSVDIKLWLNKSQLLMSGGFILLSLLALPGSGPHFVFGLEKVLIRKEIWLGSVALLGGLILLPLESLRLALDIKTIVFLKESNLPYFLVLLGFLSAAAIAGGLFYLFKLVKLGRFFNFSGLLFFIIALKALWDSSIINSLEVIISRILHDLVHWLVVFFLLPDHLYLSRSVWNFIAFFFRKDTSLLLNLAFIFSLGVFFIIYWARLPFPELPGLTRGADRRKIWAKVRRDRLRQSLSVLLAGVLLLITGYNTYGAGKSFYQPKPEPLKVKTSGLAEVSIAQVSDGMIHVYSFSLENKAIRFIIIKKPDGKFAVALDCCLICPPTDPTSYGQMGQDLFCIYCGTPIPIDTVGKPGGCNPVPIPFKVTGGSKLRFNAREAVSVWGKVNKGK